MAKQKKTWLGVLFIIVVALVVLVIISPFIIDSVLKTGIETAIKKQLNVDASVARVHLNIGKGTIEVNNLKIGNPPGYEFKNILELGSINVTANIRSLLTNTVEVNQVSLTDVAVVMEQKGLSSNLNDILKSMPEKSSAKAEEPAKKGKNVHIASLDMKNIDVKAKILPLPGKADAVGFKIASLHFSDIGGEKKSLADVIGAVFTKLSKEIVAQGSGILPKDMVGPIQENIGQAGEQILKASGSIVKDTNEASKMLKGLFQKKK